MSRLLASLLLAVLVVIAAGCGGEESSQPAASPSDLSADFDFEDELLEDDEDLAEIRQSEWEDQEGEDWELFADAYESGYYSGCEDMFAVSPDGSLYYDGYEYTEFDCQGYFFDASEEDDIPYDVPDDPESLGEALGYEEGCGAVFEQEALFALYHGQDEFTADDCGLYGAPVAVPPSEPIGCSSGAGGFEIVVETGAVDCDGALALWAEYIARAPNEGQGSGGFLELYGWLCSSASAGFAPRVGSCARADGSGEFSVFLS